MGPQVGEGRAQHGFNACLSGVVSQDQGKRRFFELTWDFQCNPSIHDFSLDLVSRIHRCRHFPGFPQRVILDACLDREGFAPNHEVIVLVQCHAHQRVALNVRLWLNPTLPGIIKGTREEGPQDTCNDQ